MVGGTGTGTGRRCKAKTVDISMKCDVIEMESVPAVKHHHHHLLVCSLIFPDKTPHEHHDDSP